jgi:hypothetical protein
MEMKEALTLARTLVEEAELPEHWQEPAFLEVFRRLLDEGSPRGAQAQPVAREAGTGASTADARSGLAHLAARVGVPESALADVFAIEGDSVALYVPSSKISTTKSKAAREVALLIAAARQSTGIDESWTDVSHVRDALTQYGRYDMSNFSKYLRDTGDVFNFRGRPLQLRLTRPGWEAAADLVKALTGSQ